MVERTRRVCPETGRDLTGVDIMAHALNLWPEPLDERKPAHRTAILRRRLLLEGGVTPAEYAERDTLLIVR